MTRSLLILLATVAVAATAATGVSFSRASFAAFSAVDVEASTASISDWLSLSSSEIDPVPADRDGYARQYNVPDPPFVASEGDLDLDIDWGAYPAGKETYVFERAFTLATPPDAFPLAGVTEVTVTAALWIPNGEKQSLHKVRIAAMGSPGGRPAVTLGPGQKYQVNVEIRSKKNWPSGEELHPHIILALTYPGGPTSYYQYDIPTVVTVL